MWFPATLLMPATLIISQNPASLSFNKIWLFYLIQTSVKVSLWSVHLYCLTLSNVGNKFNPICMLLMRAQGRPKNEGLLNASLVSASLPLDGTKAHGKVLGCEVALGKKSSTSGYCGPAPWPGTSSIFPAPEDTGEPSEHLSIRSTAEQAKWPVSAFLQESTCAESVLNWFTKHLSKSGNAISNLPKSFQFSP